MESVKISGSKTYEQNVIAILDPGDSIVCNFEVVPLDYKISNTLTPHIFLTGKKLILVYDDIAEIYNLFDLQIGFFGSQPSFNIIQQWFEGKFTYTSSEDESYLRLKESESTFRLTINELNQVPKEFVLRKRSDVQRSYMTWAMYQMIIDRKNGLNIDPMLYEMVAGNFSRFNMKTIITFFIAFIVYLLIKIIAISVFSSGINLVIDILFGFILAFMLVWAYLSIDKNLKRFRIFYSSRDQSLVNKSIV